MHRQLLITLLVAAIVIALARLRRASVRRDEARPRDQRRPDIPTGALIGYSLAAIMILAAAGVSWMRYEEGSRIVQVEVIDARTGSSTVYQVRKRELGSREFTTVDGRHVSLGASDRMERIEKP